MKQLTISIVLNEKGSAIIIAVLVLAAVTILGISASNTSNIEVLLANNEILYKQNLYKAEAAVLEGAQAIKNTPSEDLLEFNTDWLSRNDVNMANLSNWDSNGDGDDTAMTGSLPSTQYSAVYNGVAPGASIDLTNPTLLRLFSIYGYSSTGNNLNFIQIGYLIRY